MKLAKESGFKYFVFTKKHHDGFCVWPTGLRDYNISNTPFSTRFASNKRDQNFEVRQT